MEYEWRNFGNSNKVVTLDIYERGAIVCSAEVECTVTILGQAISMRSSLRLNARTSPEKVHLQVLIAPTLC